MNWTAIEAVGTWFAGLATLATVLYLVFRDYWKRPKLIATFDKTRDIKNQTNTPGLPPPAISRWLRICIQNENGRRLAKSRRAYLVGIEKIGPDGTVEKDVFPNDVRPLQWTHGSPAESARDLLPGVMHWVDLLSTAELLQALQVNCIPLYGLPMPGLYRFRVQVSAEDTVPPAPIQVLIRWDGTWDSLRPA